MTRIKYRTAHTLRLSRESIDVFDQVSRELGGISRRAAVEIVARFVRRIKDKSHSSYENLLLRDDDPTNGKAG